MLDRTLRENLSYPAYCATVDAIGRGESVSIKKDMFGTTVWGSGGTFYHELSLLVLYYGQSPMVDVEQLIRDVIAG